MPPKKSTALDRVARGAERLRRGDVSSGARAAAETHDARDGRVDARRGMATTVFTVESLGLKTTKSAREKRRGMGSSGSHRKGVATVLAAEASYDVERRVRDGRRPLRSAPLGYVERTPDGFKDDATSLSLMPARPRWDYELKRGRLHARERKAFVKWLRTAKEAMIEVGGYAPAFEQNIDVWRQLWRVLERSDVACVVVDARNPMLHLPPALYAHVTRRLRKPLVVVLNKADAVPMRAIDEWAAHLLASLPGIDAVVGYSSRDEAPPTERFWDKKSHGDEEREEAAERMHRESAIPMGREALLRVCKELARTGKRYQADAEVEVDDGADEEEDGEEEEDGVSAQEAEDARLALERENEEFEKLKSEGRVMIGLVGHPNVGKSSMVNSLMKRKAVSVKATPGHTKTLQTLIMDEETCLCDSPGLVFPRVDVTPAEQIIGSLVPLPTVREPYSAIRWLAEAKLVGAERWQAIGRKFSGSDDGKLAQSLAAPITSALKIKQSKTYDPEVLELLNNEDLTGESLPWSPLSLCQAYGNMRGFMLTRGVDLQRSGQVILGMVYEGKIPYAIPPPAGAPVVKTKADIQEIEVDEDEFEDDESDDDIKIARTGFAALAMNSDEETMREQYAYSSDEDERGTFLPISSALAKEMRYQ
ncbi:P-loop containing nucleoside triphosphate hydrolase [Ostreococcus tauri]|uniref:Guanine nucleotide-binding protein-like 1 n=1 Tax=Ostreococcus tauri TaxID=70448 RepID=A0A090N3E7_OSTTA|nr:P-loop containing nucleoside triphosphate hydrolase [Ostreococcus tauri]CEF97988.1 P-loop containing nucleoside triphosphate hydrolase [Ostreococcus tauri]|eukprot:XP_022839013.1 P-loop containing nucleoside triphosphate hydrolase [Ostreococcus tauri]